MKNEMNKDIKILFDKVGLEKPSDSFTSELMKRITSQNPLPVTMRKLHINYWVLLPYLVAILLIIPFLKASLNWIININWDFISFDLNPIREWFGSLIATFTEITITPQTILMTAVCLALSAVIAYELFMLTRRRILE